MLRIPEWNITILYGMDRPTKPDSTSRAFDERVRVAVNAISRTQSGRILLKLFRLNADAAVYITPYDGRVAQYLGTCNAGTLPISSTDRRGRDHCEGVRIYFSPDQMAMNKCGWYPGARPEEVLFHEMVHAARQLNTQMNQDWRHAFDWEEFLAAMITNVFRSELGAKTFHREYERKELGTKEEVETFLSTRQEYLDALAFSLGDVPTHEIAKLNTAFNPFRDIARLQAAHSSLAETLRNLNPLTPILEDIRWNAKANKLEDLQDISVTGSDRVMSGR